MADLDSIDARISADCPDDVQTILRAAWHHDSAALRGLLNGPGKASCRDPTTGETPLHAAIRSTGQTENAGEVADGDAIPAAKTVVEQLLLNGAIWNDVDDHNETPGCVAWRLHRPALYELLVRAGTRAEMLFAILDGYEALGSEGDEDEGIEDEKEKEEVEDTEQVGEKDTNGAETNGDAAADKERTPAKEPTMTTESAPVAAAADETPYLETSLTLADGKLVDAAGNGVMMAWETDIMRRSVDALLGEPGPDDSGGQGKRILNIGFGLGIVDSMFAARRPARHHIIEAHPAVLARIDHPTTTTTTATGAVADHDHAAAFGAAWENSGPEPGAFRVHRGRWQDICPALLAQGELYDAVYFDTFGEDYSALRQFFTDYIPGLLADDGVFGFFHGLGADRRVCYDVYTRVVALHLAEAGLDVAWRDVAVPLADAGLDRAGAGAWQGIVRPYWTLDNYRLPVCTFMG
ncbi:arginine n-methyltransferase [Niveomyces insectorum RCEF 264]|uniref:Arginine N-methyltransferase 2 n=1 Tax=Niveomyces insectorum RCEF 264 TaxID=1081102 RepID=A0A167MGJ2_9HYPO|nr:arginine n-methyltransferase [Niveomyces insectorum RCEF 264]